jgi:hypothetical protein
MGTGRKVSKESPLEAKSVYSFPSPFSGFPISPSVSGQETKDRLLGILGPSAEAIPIRNSPGPKATDSATHDKLYYDDRFNDSVFDPLLALSVQKGSGLCWDTHMCL